MGTQLVRRLEARAMAGRLPVLSPNARCALVWMAVNARDSSTDTDPEATYFRGWEHLATVALGRQKYDRAAEQATWRVIRELTLTGLIEPVGRRHDTRHGAAMYALHI